MPKSPGGGYVKCGSPGAWLGYQQSRQQQTEINYPFPQQQWQENTFRGFSPLIFVKLYIWPS